MPPINDSSSIFYLLSFWIILNWVWCFILEVCPWSISPQHLSKGRWGWRPLKDQLLYNNLAPTLALSCRGLVTGFRWMWQNWLVSGSPSGFICLPPPNSKFNNIYTKLPFPSRHWHFHAISGHWWDAGCEGNDFQFWESRRPWGRAGMCLLAPEPRAMFYVHLSYFSSLPPQFK